MSLYEIFNSSKAANYERIHQWILKGVADLGSFDTHLLCLVSVVIALKTNSAETNEITRQLNAPLNTDMHREVAGNIALPADVSIR